MTDPTNTNQHGADMARFWGSGVAAVGAGVAFRAAPSMATGIAFSGAIGNLYAASQAPGVRATFGNSYGTLSTAMGSIDNERMNNSFWHPGRRGI
ncbi:hypothetical protein [Actinophytocola sediminis]